MQWFPHLRTQQANSYQNSISLWPILKGKSQGYGVSVPQEILLYDTPSPTSNYDTEQYSSRRNCILSEVPLSQRHTIS